MDSSSSQLIKPCRVQITDLRKMKNQEDHFREALDESNQQPSTSSGSGEMQPQGACTVLIVPNQEPSTTTSSTQEGKPSEGTMLIVSEDGWIEGEPKSPKSDIQQSSDDHMSGMESDFDIDENDGEDGDWIPDPGSDSDENDEPNSENKEEENTQSGAIDLDEPLTNETLKKIMEVVYGVSTPNVATLGLLKEQMDERPKLKLKLLKDLQRGHSMFKKRHKYKNVVVKRQLIETPSPVKVHVQNTMPQWAPHQPLTLAKATAHLAAHHSKGEIKGSLPDIPPAQPRLPPPYVYRSIAPKQPLQAAGLPQQNGIMNTGLVLSTRPSVAMTSSSVPPGSMNTVPALPTRPSVAMTVSSVPPGSMNSVPALPTRPSVAVTSTPVNPGSNILQNTSKPQTNICFKDISSPLTRAIFMPENRTVNIPELHPSPAGCLDVLVPVDATGQMKEPFMGIPLDSCNLIFKSDSEEGTQKSNVQSGKETPRRRSNDENPSVPAQNIKQEGQSGFQSIPMQPSSTQSNATLPSAGVFPNPQSATSAAPGILPTRAPLTAGLLPPGMVPVGLALASARPSGVFPSHMFPPGSIPSGMVPVALPPDALRFPVPGPHVNCTCPSGSRPPGPPVHSLLHLQQEDLNKLSATGTVSPAINHSSETPDERNESPLTTSNNNIRAESSGIKIASVRSCTSDEDLSDRTSSSSKVSAQAGASSSKTETAGMGLLLTVLLPSSAKERYKHKLNPKSTSNPLTADLKEIHKPATKVDLGMVWNEISLLRTEIQTIKTKVASDIHNIRTDMEEFVKLVGARLGITPQIPVTQQNKTVQESEGGNDGGGNDGGRKRKAVEGELEEQILKKRAKNSSDYLL